LFSVLLGLALPLAGCGGASASPGKSERLQVVTTVGMVTDLTGDVGHHADGRDDLEAFALPG
ncbi:MAG: hypothetical protein K8E66_04745, partial [Phycisphaerales bacterium]|nr:hypothetical protein [Phycisphaerales bacterium]